MSSSFILSWWVKSIFLCLNNKILIELIVPELKQSLRGYSVHVPLYPKAKYAFLMHQSIWSFNILPFPLDNPWEFYCFPCPRSGEFEPLHGWGGGGGGEFEPVECVTFDFTTFVDHTENCLKKIVLDWGIWMQFWPMVGRNFNKPIFKSLNALGVACGRDVTASNWLMHYNLDLKPVLLQSILCCYSSLC